MQFEHSSPPTRRVLLLEDDEIDRLSIRRALEQSTMPFECDHVDTLAGANTKIKQNKYDVILSDMHLPDSSGLDTLTSLLNFSTNLPIVVLSGTDDDRIALEAIQAGAQDYFPKQYLRDAGLINRILRHAIERHQLKVGLESTRDRAHFLAHYDQCTALPNRVLFLDRVHQAVLQAKRNNHKFFIFFVDLDRFKNVNDSIGHGAGDKVLQCVSTRMQELVRESDTVARFGGDEFVLLLQLSDNNEAMQNLAERLVEAINQPIPIGNHLVSIGASVGISSYPRHGFSPDLLIKNADIAMYEAKRKGRNRVQFFSDEIFEKRSHFFNIEKALREAINDPDANFTIYFQPRFDLQTGNIVSAEALIRWFHKDMGNIATDQFIPIAEDLGLIEQIDEWVIASVFEKTRDWQEMGESVHVGINISGKSFDRRDFVSNVVEPLLKKYGVDGSSFEMEITESVLLADARHILQSLNALKALGISLAIDDFGTGFSSLSYLSQFPIDTLKIDGSFICDKDSSPRQQALLDAIVLLGKALDMKVVAECVETKAQEECLLNANCHEAQGFYLCMPEANWTPDSQ